MNPWTTEQSIYLQNQEKREHRSMEPAGISNPRTSSLHWPAWASAREREEEEEMLTCAAIDAAARRLRRPCLLLRQGPGRRAMPRAGSILSCLSPGRPGKIRRQ
jgi:hypothetical protein